VSDAVPSDPGPGKGFRARKREDHALILIRQLLESLQDLPKARRLMRELGRYYDPVLGGVIMEVAHQRAIVECIEARRIADAEALIKRRYELYVKDRAHLGRGEE